MINRNRLDSARLSRLPQRGGAKRPVSSTHGRPFATATGSLSRIPSLPSTNPHAQASDADYKGVRVSFGVARVRWDWRLSAHFRLVSLASAWVLVLLCGVLGPLLTPIAAVRFVFSSAQTVLNIRLGKDHPVGRQTRVDWTMVALVFAGAYVAVGIGHLIGNLTSPVVYVPMLIPFTVLQVRLARRAYHAHGPVKQRGGIRELPARPTAEPEAA